MFKTVNALKDHMISKCHCKLLWDDDVDVGEYEEFFDFTKNDKDDEDDTPLEYIYNNNYYYHYYLNE